MKGPRYQVAKIYGLENLSLLLVIGLAMGPSAAASLMLNNVLFLTLFRNRVG